MQKRAIHCARRSYIYHLKGIYVGVILLGGLPCYTQHSRSKRRDHTTLAMSTQTPSASAGIQYAQHGSKHRATALGCPKRPLGEQIGGGTTILRRQLQSAVLGCQALKLTTTGYQRPDDTCYAICMHYAESTLCDSSRWYSHCPYRSVFPAKQLSITSSSSRPYTARMQYPNSDGSTNRMKIDTPMPFKLQLISEVKRRQRPKSLV